jgi:hypothetical protein
VAQATVSCLVLCLDGIDVDPLEEVKKLREEYERSLDAAESRRAAYHEAVHDLHRGGMPLREIAQQLGLSHQRVHQIVSDAPPRQRSIKKALGGGVAAVLLLGSLFGALRVAQAPPFSAKPPPAAIGVKARTEAAVARVQTSAGAGAAFRMFPQTQSRAACRIPAALGRGIKGMCETRVSFTGRDSHPVVTFTEIWSASLFRTGGSPNRTLQHSWRFEVQTHGIRGLGSHGALPPQAAD